MNIKKIQLYLKLIGVILGVLFLFGFGVSTVKPMPSYAKVFVDLNKNVYLAPACVPKENWEITTWMTSEQAHKLKFKPDQKCIDEDGFREEQRSVSGILLEKIGLLP